MARKTDVGHSRKTALCSHIIESTSFKDIHVPVPITFKAA